MELNKSGNDILKYAASSNWYILYIRSRSEKKVKERLEKRNIEVFLPLIKTVRQWSDRKKTITVPLFNGYLFIRTDPTEFAMIRMIEGVVNFVQQEKRYAILTDEQIASIRSFLETGLPVQSSPDIFNKGENVRINFGPLKNYCGELIEIKNEKQFLVRLEVINQVLIINVPSAYIEKI